MFTECCAADAVSFTDVSVWRGDVAALEAMTARVPRGGCTAVIGPNGAGKTSLLLALLGEIPFRGRICRAPDTRIGYVPQRIPFDRGLPLTVCEFLALGQQVLPLWCGIGRRARMRTMELLDCVRATALAERRLGVLSGGETQRVLLALALSQNPSLLILDEPAAGVDVRGGFLFCELLEDLRSAHGFTQLMVSHDLGMVTHHATHVICLNHRVIAEGAPRKVLTGQTLMTLFGMHMGLVDARAMPEQSAACRGSCCGGPHA